MEDLGDVSSYQGLGGRSHTIVFIMCRIRDIGLQETGKFIWIVESCHIEREAGIISNVYTTQRFGSQKLEPMHISPLE